MAVIQLGRTRQAKKAFGPIDLIALRLHWHPLAPLGLLALLDPLALPAQLAPS